MKGYFGFPPQRGSPVLIEFNEYTSVPSLLPDHPGTQQVPWMAPVPPIVQMVALDSFG